MVGHDLRPSCAAEDKNEFPQRLDTGQSRLCLSDYRDVSGRACGMFSGSAMNALEKAVAATLKAGQ